MIADDHTAAGDGWLLLALEMCRRAISPILAHDVAPIIVGYFWHFGHQNVERPFWVKRFTVPSQPGVGHFSPSRS